jgi:hypothetical protein
VVSDKYEEYRRNAMVCERMSRTTSSQDIRASWLRLAESWLRMVPQDFAEETFNLATEGADQGNPKRSH